MKYQAVLTDIEGTTTPISFVHQTLFPYARKRLGSILHMDNDEINAALKLLREEFAQDKQANRPQDFGDGIGYLEYLMEHDVKSTALKKIQGILWHDGYVCGELKSDIYDDVVVALKEWKQKGIVVKVFSSGSVLAQKLLFGHSNHGDLLEYFAGFHDTTTGPKKEKESYIAISKQFGLPTQNILFLSDVVAELDAAREAGMQTGLFIRPGNKPVVANGHPSYDDFRKLL